MSSGGLSCCVKECKSVFGKENEISFHRFPKEPKVLKQWIDFCNFDQTFVVKNKRVCSIHFCNDDYIRDLKGELLNLPTKKNLKKTAFPVKLIVDICNENVSPPAVDIFTQHMNQFVTDGLSTEKSPPGDDSNLSVPVFYSSESISPPELTAVDNSKQYEEMKLQVISYKSQVETKDEELLKLKDFLRNQVNMKRELECTKFLVKSKDDEIFELKENYKKLSDKLKFAEESSIKLKQLESQLKTVKNDALKSFASLKEQTNRNKDLEKENKNFKDNSIDKTELPSKLKELLKNSMTANQIDVILGKKKFAKWTTSEISNAFTLRYFSKRAYLFLRNTLHYPLPALSSLQRWASKIEIRYGLAHDVLRMMELMGKDQTDQERAVIIMFDEMKVEKIYEYDVKEDEVVGPYNYLQVVMVRGLFSNYKQTIYLAFDTQISEIILNEIVTALYNIKFNVVAVVSDCGGGNRGLWKKLQISPDKSWFVHPISGKSIYVIPDGPHLLKLIRNWLLDTGMF